MLADAPELRMAIAPLLEARNMMRKQKALLDRQLGVIARQDAVCKRLMTVPGIGPIISSATVAAIGNGAALSKGRDFGAWLGLARTAFHDQRHR